MHAEARHPTRDLVVAMHQRNKWGEKQTTDTRNMIMRWVYSPSPFGSRRQPRPYLGGGSTVVRSGRRSHGHVKRSQPLLGSPSAALPLLQRLLARRAQQGRPRHFRPLRARIRGRGRLRRGDRRARAAAAGELVEPFGEGLVYECVGRGRYSGVGPSSIVRRCGSLVVGRRSPPASGPSPSSLGRRTPSFVHRSAVVSRRSADRSKRISSADDGSQSGCRRSTRSFAVGRNFHPMAKRNCRPSSVVVTRRPSFFVVPRPFCRLCIQSWTRLGQRKAISARVLRDVGHLSHDFHQGRTLSTDPRAGGDLQGGHGRATNTPRSKANQVKYGRSISRLGANGARVGLSPPQIEPSLGRTEP